MKEYKVRRVVTGDDAQGRSRIAADEEIALIDGVCTIWGSDSFPVVPCDGTIPPCPTWFAPPGGSRVVFFTIPPDGQEESDVVIDYDQQEFDEGGWHATDTVDIIVLMSGEVSHECEGDEPVTLRPGDVLVQNGTRHTWHNHGPETAFLCGFMVGAERRVA